MKAQSDKSILTAENIMLEPEVMQRLGRTELGVSIPDGEGFIGTLNVYHEREFLLKPITTHHFLTLNSPLHRKSFTEEMHPVFWSLSDIESSQKRLYQYMYQEHYWLDLNDNQRELNRLHNGVSSA